MPDRDIAVLYDEPPIWAKLVGWLLLGTGGLVLAPVALVNGAAWLFILAMPPLLAGLLLFQTRLCITLNRRTGLIMATNYLLGLRFRQRRYPASDIVGVDVHRVAGAERERASDTWYLRLQLRARAHTIGKYDTRLEALEARRELSKALQPGPRPQTAVEMKTAAEESLRSEPDSAAGHYQMGLALLRSGDKAQARQAFQKALALVQKPLLRRMVEQRLEELNQR